jgi:hypothetical protein
VRVAVPELRYFEEAAFDQLVVLAPGQTGLLTVANQWPPGDPDRKLLGVFDLDRVIRPRPGKRCTVYVESADGRGEVDAVCDMMKPGAPIEMKVAPSEPGGPIELKAGPQ